MKKYILKVTSAVYLLISIPSIFASSIPIEITPDRDDQPMASSSSNLTAKPSHRKALSETNPRMRESSFFKELTADLSPEEEAAIKRNEERAKLRNFNILLGAAKGGDNKAILAIKLKSYQEGNLGEKAENAIKNVIGNEKVKAAMGVLVKSSKDSDIDMAIKLAEKDPELKKILINRIIELDNSLSEDSKVVDVTKTLGKYPIDLVAEAIGEKSSSTETTTEAIETNATRNNGFFSRIKRKLFGR